MGILIKQLMQLAKTDSVAPNMEKINLSRVVIGELLAFESVAFEKGVALKYDDIAQNVFIYANSPQISQVVSILVDNAIEHSLPNSIVTAKLCVKHNKALLYVTNFGNEIPNEQRKLIFERFYRADYSRNSENNHYGLGLAIAKSIVTAHHGNISVSCKNGLVTFAVSIPFGHI
jgi:signal transduction histidine kinase